MDASTEFSQQANMVIMCLIANGWSVVCVAIWLTGQEVLCAQFLQTHRVNLK